MDMLSHAYGTTPHGPDVHTVHNAEAFNTRDYVLHNFRNFSCAVCSDLWTPLF